MKIEPEPKDARLIENFEAFRGKVYCELETFVGYVCGFATKQKVQTSLVNKI
jgi:hypothetical protein